ncbi:hypothetical protein Taro_013713 [Colocasia esculenta]|uniref:Uncharacterized protein n=1 Tax=Colocasia esculenta TaxID=4460 RepID=A0A843UMZ9_COLES|nr:hypothetical protein [Colocasia esculenta]
MGYKQQGIWPLISQLKNLASNDIDAKLLNSRTKGIIPYLRTRLNLLNSPDPHRILRELLRQLHHVPAFPWPIRHRLTFHVGVNMNVANQTA